MAIRLSGTFSPAGLRLEAWIAFASFVDYLRTDLQYDGDIWLSSGTDGKHGTGSLHYVGLAIDPDLVGSDGPDLLEKCYRALSVHLAPKYDVVLHRGGDGVPTHLHMEFQPKTP